MENLPHKKSLTIIALCIGCVLLVVAIVLLSSKLPMLSFNNQNQLAQIIAIETELLKRWQQNGSLKNTLSYNSEGSDIILLQRMLSQDSVAYPEKKITGYYGDLTTRAVRKFQKEYGLPQTGDVDTATRKKLNDIFLSHLCPEPVVAYPEFLMRKITNNSPLPLDYVPPRLIDVSSKIKTVGIACLRSDIVPYVEKMFADARSDGVELMISSSYRKPEIQSFIFDFWIQVEGPSAINEVAKSGFSEHQLGTTIDVTDSSINFAGVDDRFTDSDGGQWMRANAYKYGFVMSFPEEKQAATGFVFEPWHWRYVGVNVATALHDTEITYIESNFDVDEFPPTKVNAEGLTLSANAFLSVYVGSDGTEKVLIKKNDGRQLPLASITKLMVALVAQEQHKNDDQVCISENSLKIKGVSGVYHTGDCFLFSDALYALLLASHNEIAIALSEQIGTNTFVSAMNQKARSIGLSNTVFVNATGLDPVAGSDEINRSTVSDVYKLVKYVQENHPELLSITTRENYNLFDTQQNLIVTIASTNKLLTQQNIPFHILGGKIGETPRAKQNLVIVSDSPCDGKMFSVILGSQNSFENMQNLLWYTNNSYQWSCKSY